MRTARKFLFIIFVVFFALASQATTIHADISAGSQTTLLVPPRASDYQLSITNNVGGSVPEDTTITYTVTYGALASAAVTANGTLTVNIGLNSLDGVTHVTDYVVGSATNAYGDAPPIVDLVNNTITWNIPNLPPGTTDQIVTFQLRTNGTYTQTNPVHITVPADFSNQYMTMPQQAITTNYVYRQPAPGPTSTPTPVLIPSITPTITIAPKPLTIDVIKPLQISPSSVTLSIVTSKKTLLNAFYGVSPTGLFQLVSDTASKQTHTLQITKLNPETTYYLKITATDENGDIATSDVLRFITAKPSNPVSIDQQSVILVSGNNPLLTTNPSLPFAQVLIPYNKLYTIGLRIAAPQNVKQIVALVENAHVLAANTFSNVLESNTWSAPMIEQQPGIYIAQLSSPPTPSVYDVFAQISDKNGNLTQTKIAETIVYGPVKVVDKATGKGIEHARIFLSLYNTTKKAYEPIYNSDIQENPLYTDTNGIALINTGAGKYKVSISQYDYQTQILFFSIDKAHLTPPLIKLKHIGFTVGGFTQYYIDTITDFTNQLVAGIQDIQNTTRFFKLISLLVLASLIVVTFLLFLIRTRLSLVVIPLFLKHHVQRVGIVHGQILDAITHLPVALATVAISNKVSHEVLTTTLSNKSGVFYLDSKWVSSENNMNILAQGYRTNKFAINETVFPAVMYLRHNLVGGPFHHPIIAGLISLAGSFFETLLVASFILEIFFIPTIGIVSLLFVGLSLLNVFFWILYHRESILF